MKFEIHFEFRASLRKFQDLNFWDATLSQRIKCAKLESWSLRMFFVSLGDSSIRLAA
jgi:hypothetical protein